MVSHIRRQTYAGFVDPAAVLELFGLSVMWGRWGGSRLAFQFSSSLLTLHRLREIFRAARSEDRLLYLQARGI